MKFTNSPIISSWCWHDDFYQGKFSLLDMPAIVSEMGISVIEMNDFMLPPAPRTRLIQWKINRHSSVPKASWRYHPSTLETLKERLDEHGIQCAVWTMDTDFTLTHKANKYHKAYLENGLYAAKMVGASMLRITIGQEPEADKTPISDEVLNQLVALKISNFVKKCAVEAPELQISIENHGGISADPARLLHILQTCYQQIDPTYHSNLGVCLDTGNFEANGHEKGWELLLPYAIQVHAKVYEFSAEGHPQQINYDAFRTLLNGSTSLPVTFEYEGDQAVEIVLPHGLHLLDTLQ